MAAGLAVAAPASAAQTDGIGTPGAPNCVGQTNSFLAQFGHDVGINGLGNLTSEWNISVKALQAEVQTYCTV